MTFDKPFFGRLVTFEDRFNDLLPYQHFLFKKDYEVLDIGCAEGDITRYIAMIVKYVYAFDNDRNKKFRPLSFHNIRYHWGEFPTIPYFGRQYFDTVLCMGVYNKLSEKVRIKALNKLLEVTNKYLIVRSDQDFKFIKKFIVYSGFKHLYTTTGTEKAHPAFIFQNPHPYSHTD